MSSVNANKRNTESKYVSVFADSRPDVDVTFSQELLNRPADHFVVGVDNLTVSLNSLSLLELEDGDVLRIGRIAKTAAGNYYNAVQTTQQNLDSAVVGVPVDLVYPAIASYSITSGKNNGLPFYNVQQFLRGLLQPGRDGSDPAARSICRTVLHWHELRPGKCAAERSPAI